jgi:hypothetical protein
MTLLVCTRPHRSGNREITEVTVQCILLAFHLEIGKNINKMHCHLIAADFDGDASQIVQLDIEKDA